MNRAKKRYASVLRRYLKWLLLATTGLTTCIWIFAQYQSFQRESVDLRDRYLKSQQAIIADQINRSLQYIEYQRQLARRQLESRLQSRVDQAWELLQSLAGRQRLQDDRPEMQRDLRETLRGLRWAGGRGYFFAIDPQGVIQVHGGDPTMEGQNPLREPHPSSQIFRRLQQIARQQGAGFQLYRWPKPEQTTRQDWKLTYVKLFEPLGWTIGTGEYLDEFEQATRQSVMEHLAGVRYADDEGYIFIVDDAGRMLANGARPEMVGEDVRNFTDRNGVKVLQQLMIAANGDSDTPVTYEWDKPSTGLPAPKISLSRKVPDWNWIIGSGLYVDDIEQVVVAMRQRLLTSLYEDVTLVLVLLALLLTLASLAARHFAARVQTDLEAFADFFTATGDQDQAIDRGQLAFEEFDQLAATANEMLAERLLAEQALRQSEKKFRSIFNTSFQFIGLLRPDGSILDLNRTLLNFADRSLVQLRNRPLWQAPWWPAEPSPEGGLRQAVEACARGRLVRFEQQIQGADGQRLNVDFSFKPVTDSEGRIVQLIAEGRDITERKRAEEERERLNLELIGKNKELEQIVYIASHDLRSPLVNVQGYSRELDFALEELEQLLDRIELTAQTRSQLAELIGSEIPEALNFIRNSSDKMETLLAGLLKLSRSGRAALQIETLDMDRLLAEVAANFEYRIRQQQIDLQLAPLPPCKGDAAQVNQVFSNLLGNAIKYLDRQRPGQISIRGVQKDGESIYIVEDNGIGIAREHQERVFEIFHRLNPTESDGEGLGLTIVQRVLGRLQGRSWLEATPDVGSRFHVALPAGYLCYDDDHQQEHAGNHEPGS